MEVKKRADKTLYVANQMSMCDFLLCPLVCQQSPSENQFYLCSVLFDPGEGTTCVPLEELLQAGIGSTVGTSLVQCRNYFRVVNLRGTEDHNFQ